MFGSTLFLNRTDEAKTGITTVLIVRIVMKTFVSRQMIRIVFVLVQNAYVDRLVTTRIQHRCSRNLRLIERLLHLRKHQTMSGTKSVRILVGEITFDCQRTDDTIETVDSELVVRMNAGFTSQTGLTAFLCATKRCD